MILPRSVFGVLFICIFIFGEFRLGDSVESFSEVLEYRKYSTKYANDTLTSVLTRKQFVTQYTILVRDVVAARCRDRRFLDATCDDSYVYQR